MIFELGILWWNSKNETTNTFNAQNQKIYVVLWVEELGLEIQLK